MRAVTGTDAPGRERIASSPLVIGLVAALALLVGMGFWLKNIIASTVADRTFNRARQNFDDGDYRTAIRDFDSFLKTNPKDARQGEARVLQAMANVRQYCAPDGSTWSSALEAASEMLDRVGGLDEFRDQRVDLSEQIIKIGEGLADRARRAADAQALSEAEQAVSLHARAAGETATAFLTRSSLPAKLAQARAAVRKAEVRSRALATMDKALADGSASRVYDARDALLDQYADLARDKEIVARMTKANEAIRKAVTVDPTKRPAAKQPRPDPLGPPTSLVLRSRPKRAGGAPAESTIIFALADGFGYALRGADGAPLWHVPLGLAAPFAPQAVPGDATAIAFDSRFNELVRLDAATGALRWRLEVGEPIESPPLVLGNQLAQVLKSGKLLWISLESGELQSTFNLGRPVARTPVHDEAGQHLYVLGRQDCLFVLSRDPPSCVAVDYLGHTDGAIPCAPARLGRFLVIPDNESLGDSRWHILVLDQDGAQARPVQSVAISGWTWDTPTSAGSIVWATGDKGGYEAFAVGDYASKTPFRSIARLIADAGASGPSYALARTDRELWLAAGHSGRFALDPERGTIEPSSPLAQPGPACAPIQTAGKLVVLTFQDLETGGVVLWGLDAETAEFAWKTVLGAPWPTPLAASIGQSGLALVGRDGREVSIAPAQLAKGGFIEQNIPLPGDFVLPQGVRLRPEVDGKSLSVIAPRSLTSELWAQDPKQKVGWRRIGLPVAPAVSPIAWGGGILVPGRDARAYLIDPLTAQSRAEPFVPKFDRDRQGVWRSPAVIDGDTVVLADQMGRVHRVELKTTPVPRLVGEAQATLDQPVVTDPVSTGGTVVVVTADQRVRSLSVRDLSPAGSWPLEAPLAGPPSAIHDGCLVADRAGGVMAFSRDGQRTWSIKLSAAVVGTPLQDDHAIWFVTQDGYLQVRARSDGAQLQRLGLGILPSGGLLRLGDVVLVGSGRGTICALAAELSTASQTPRDE